MDTRKLIERKILPKIFLLSFIAMTFASCSKDDATNDTQDKYYFTAKIDGIEKEVQTSGGLGDIVGFNKLQIATIGLS
ncbi:MAG: hypothetical protein K0R59_95 [Sphingobacterium sp.]|jgi:hypothetical protein|nr:hypothetical protein [Sphingobacterium sp.]